MPGGFSPLLARMCELAGFEAFFLAGSQTSAFLYGVPDTGIIGLRDMVDHARHVAAHCNIPVLADGDTGYGNAVNVHFAVQEFIRAGVAGMHVEDQEAPKKSGTGAGRRCISLEEAVGKFQAATAARDALDPEFVICARCDLMGAERSRGSASEPATSDGRQSETGTFDEAVERCVAYVEQGHADFIWINTLQTRDQIAEACRRIPAPVLAAYGGPPPGPTLEEFQTLGASVALFPALTTSAALQATWDLLHDFKERGTAALQDAGARARSSRWGPVDRGKLVGTEQVQALEKEFLPDSIQRDYEGTFGFTDHRPD